ncbi:MAG: hypothetical protein RLZZ210_1613, partial [Pseudomonadota bacterium]
IIDKMIAYSLTKDFYTDIDIPSYKVGDKWYPLPRIPTENDPLMQNSIESLNRPYGIEHNFPKYSHKENIKNFGYTKQNVSVKEFKQQNPNCCVLDEQARFAERFINKDEKNAGINYFFKIKIPMTYNETANKKQTVLYLYETPVTNCGEDATISQNIITYDDDWFPDPYLSIFDYVKFLKQDSRH